MQHSILITEELLHSKADFADSRGLIPELLLKLIAASIKSPTELRIPFGGSVGQPGWDGFLVSPHPFPPYVPDGQSFWEFSTAGNPENKANENFEKRTKITKEADRKSSTFIFVTPRSASHGWIYDKQKQWIDDRRRISDWNDIRVIDATKLTQWLYLFPGIEYWLAGQFGIPTRGLLSPVLHWEDLKRHGAPPDLKPDVFLIGRENAIEKLLCVFRGETTELLLETRYPEEGIDFVSAVLASLDVDKKDAFAGRCLIIDDPETWKALCTLHNSHVLVANSSLDLLGTGASLRSQARNKGHGVVFAGIPLAGIHGNSVRLTEAKPYVMEKVLISCGYPSEKARLVSSKCAGRTIILKRLLLDISASPDWASTDIASELAIAALIGQWNGNFEDDQRAIEGILGKPYGEWLGKIRPMTSRPDPPLIQRDEKWRFVSRFEGWQSLGSYLSNSDLEKFQEQALIVLKEKDPKFELPSGERWKASIHKKNSRYSDSIKQGFTETLALLGAHPLALSSCSVGKSEFIAATTVRKIFEDSDWILWASLNSELPLLAEAAPEQFLDVVETMLNDPENTVFHDLFSQEGSGFLGGWNYMTGVLWALETLAWHQDYLTRVTIILGHLAEIDPGGNWANRPLNSLVTIFLPWLPQTCATLNIRKVAIETLLKEHPKIGWKLLLALLPNSRQVSSGSRKPSWREYIPFDHKEEISRGEFFEQVTIYANLVVQTAVTDFEKISEIIRSLDDLPKSAQSEILKYLSSDTVLSLPEHKKVDLWETLLDLVIKHRKFADAAWAISKELVNRIEEVANSLKPSTPELTYRRIFCQPEFELIEEKEDYEKQWQALGHRRVKAIREILDFSGLDGVVGFTLSVTDTQQVGIALGEIGINEYDKFVLPKYLVHADKKMENFAAGYVWGRFEKNGWPWVTNLEMEHWSNEEKSTFLTMLPFGPETWQLSKSLLGENEVLFWKKTKAQPYRLRDSIHEAIELLLKHGRPRAAIQCLYWMTHENMQISVTQVHQALIDNLASDEPISSMDHHAIIKLIQWLQSNTDPRDDSLFQIEWNYLPLLDEHHGLTPKTLERRLAEDPTFFAELIRLIFRSEKEDKSIEEPTEEKKLVASNAADLLFKWRTPPGTMQDGTFKGKALKTWVDDAKRLCEASGHLKISLDRIGKVLAHSPADPSGLWLHKDVAEVLNDKEHEVMRTAFRVELFNQRGMFTWTAGEEERKIATSFRNKASALDRESFFRLAASMRDLAASYEHDADREAAKDPYET